MYSISLAPPGRGAGGVWLHMKDFLMIGLKPAGKLDGKWKRGGEDAKRALWGKGRTVVDRQRLGVVAHRFSAKKNMTC